jgi:hypothetical protein
LHSTIDKIGQDPQYSPVPLRRPENEDMFQLTISAIIRRYDNIKGILRKKPPLYIIIQPEILLYQRRNNETFKTSQFVSRYDVSSGRVLRNGPSIVGFNLHLCN